ncbi:hypothetical protein EJD97_015189 [Solanum chilense]|uniref:Uncharacterized protein n=1 Tax=Solanum chilense TaxID=4083 RepID=A0A6N2CDG6_SOLCI|nr:hypothetical protein EJD97_015189 [Solanum chilense]
MSPYKLVYGKACHSPIELENKAMWVMKKLKMDWNETAEKILNGLNELDKFHLKAYESSTIYKEKMKKYHDQMIENREFLIGDFMLLYNSRLRLFLGNLKSKWTDPFLITKVISHGVVELENKDRAKFIVNGQRIKLYPWHMESVHEVVEAYNLDEVWVIKETPLCNDVKSNASWEATRGLWTPSTVRRSIDRPSMVSIDPSIAEVRIITDLHVQLDPKKDIVYVKWGKSKYVVPSCWTVEHSKMNKILHMSLRVPLPQHQLHESLESTLTGSPFGATSRSERESRSESASESWSAQSSR